MALAKRFMHGNSVLAGGLLLGLTSVPAFSAPASALQDWSIDPDTGLACASSDCTYFRLPNNDKCICKKLWPGNDRAAVRLDCVEKVRGHRVPCSR